MGAGASLVIEPEDISPSGLHPDASPADAIQFCRRFIGALQQQKQQQQPAAAAAGDGGDDGDDEASVMDYEERHAALGELVPLGDLLALLQHLDASMIWLNASDNRNQQAEMQAEHVRERRAALQVRLERRRAKAAGRSAGQVIADDLEEIVMDDAGGDGGGGGSSSGGGGGGNRGGSSGGSGGHRGGVPAAAAITTTTILIKQVQAVVVDSVVWVTRLLEFGNSSVRAGQTTDGLSAFGESVKLLEFVKNLSDDHNITAGLGEQKQTTDAHGEPIPSAGGARGRQRPALPWDRFSEYIVELPLLLLLKSREIKRGVSMYYDIEAMMYGMREGFGMMGIGEEMAGMLEGGGGGGGPRPPMYHKEAVCGLLKDAMRDNEQSSGRIRVLDVGCGMGSLLGDCCQGECDGRSMQRSVDYIGVDFSKECIRMAIQRHSSAGASPLRYRRKTRGSTGGGDGGGSPSSSPPLREFRKEDIVSSSFESASFDVVVVNEVLGFLPASETLLVLSKIKNWVSIHGRVFLSAPLISEKEEMGGGGSDAGGGAGDTSGGSNNFMVGLERSHPEIPGLFFRMFRRSELVRMASAVGLRVCRVDIAEPKGKAGGAEPTSRLPPRYALGKNSAWGQQLQETQEQQQQQQEQEQLSSASLTPGGFTGAKSTASASPSYRCITLILEKEN
jgi:SAM-dependent methyltransferase